MSEHVSADPASIATDHELDAPPWRRLDATIMAAARSIRQLYDRRLADLGINLSQASLLAFVAEFGPHSQTRLAQRLALGRAATGSLVDSLERRGLVTRVADVEDRRVWLVDITSEGRVVAEQIALVDRALRAQLRRGIPKADRQQLATLLLRLQANLEEAL